MTIRTHRPPTRPGELLLEDFLKPLKMTQVQAARKMGIPLNRLNELIRSKRGMTADTALRLAKLFKTSPMFWMNLQSAVDRYEAQQGVRATLSCAEVVCTKNTECDNPRMPQARGGRERRASTTCRRAHAMKKSKTFATPRSRSTSAYRQKAPK